MSKAEDESFLARWSRRKREAAERSGQPEDAEGLPETESGSDTAEAASAGPDKGPGARSQGGAGKGTLKRVLTEADFADVDFGALDFKSDYTRFMQPGVPEAIRNKALRKLWVADPVMANMDGLHDYWEDYTDAAVAVPRGTLKTVYRVGRGFLSDQEVAEWEALGKPPTAAAAAPAAEAAAPGAQSEDVASGEDQGTGERSEAPDAAAGNVDRDTGGDGTARTKASANGAPEKEES